MKIIRWLLGRLILAGNFVFSPKGVKRDPALQDQIDQQTQNLSLYQYEACPFCVKVRRSMKRLSLNVALKDAKTAPHQQDLVNGGGALKVPCLRIEKDGKTTWMYESSDIVSYLEQEYS
ncbi:glutathione S-transferase N-terminal domain-containing protein [Motilimonas pumila]|uniref:Glutaredoxin n=1 Tax=Motilimonas pumila TaxID=2303987 RepID=A0A418YFD1_9GAMM|nr:glutathione S-transferase N-terminal domain-containing protein [Motilimonas pumila]RJG48090.1 glutaredoxin [Motilimonas pumila]